MIMHGNEKALFKQRKMQYHFDKDIHSKESFFHKL